jgi:enamine deaminase RidA (YjgF/YER057c/UK114 family)
MVHKRIRPYTTRVGQTADAIGIDLCHAVVAGKTVYLRGQVGQSMSSGESVGIGDAAAQTEEAMRNIEILLGEAGCELSHVVKLVVYLVDPRLREPVYGVLARWLRGVHPVSTGVVVSLLARPEWLVEIDVVAVMS